MHLSSAWSFQVWAIPAALKKKQLFPNSVSDFYFTVYIAFKTWNYAPPEVQCSFESTGSSLSQPVGVSALILAGSGQV